MRRVVAAAARTRPRRGRLPLPSSSSPLPSRRRGIETGPDLTALASARDPGAPGEGILYFCLIFSLPSSFRFVLLCIYMQYIYIYLLARPPDVPFFHPRADVIPGSAAADALYSGLLLVENREVELLLLRGESIPRVLVVVEGGGLQERRGGWASGGNAGGGRVGCEGRAGRTVHWDTAGGSCDASGELNASETKRAKGMLCTAGDDGG